MLTQGIITYVFSDQLYNVRIPLFETIYSGATIVQAHTTNFPGIFTKLKIGDMVWVGFELNRADKPVILGLITSKYNDSAKIGINADTLTVSNSATIPYDTKISNSIKGYSSIKELVNGIESWKSSQSKTQRNIFRIELDDMYTYRIGTSEYQGKKFFGQATILVNPTTTTGLLDEFVINSTIEKPIDLKFTCYNKAQDGTLTWYDSSTLFRFKVSYKDHKVRITYEILNTDLIIPGSSWTVSYELIYAN